jgi:hypothetical protein
MAGTQDQVYQKFGVSSIVVAGSSLSLAPTSLVAVELRKAWIHFANMLFIDFY